MSALALGRGHLRGRPARAGGEGLGVSAVRLAAFAALLAFAAGHWGTLVVDAPAGKIALVVLVTVAGAAALVASRQVALPRTAATVLRVAIALVTAALAMGALGLPLKLLWPANWDVFADGVDRGLSAMNNSAWPYSGDDPWVRLTVLLGIPAAGVPAALLSFWPSHESDAARGRLGALVMLLALYGMAVTERGLGSPGLRGLALLLLVAAWLWLPRLAPRDGLAAALAVGACTLLAIPLAAGLDRDAAWVDYDEWALFNGKSGGTRYAWDHQYGPIDWPRDGTPLLDFRSRESHYWKAETLDHFDGLRWIHSNLNSNTGPGGELPQPLNPRWIEDIRVTVRRLRSELIVAAGTPLFVDGDKVTRSSADGTTRVMDSPLERGDTYRVRAYVPDPTARQMRRAPRAFPEQMRPYTAFTLPTRRQSGLRDDPVTETDRSRIFTRRTVAPPFAGAGLSPADERRVVTSPYGETFRLARRLAAGNATTYDTVKSVQRHLLDNYAYSERPPSRRYPLAAFLFQDRAGYCQQFSGAMALLLRMNGIPARVAAGFAPGTLDKARNEYRVRDLDAHSWVEVWFTGLGWVPFDPTPPLSPAESQSSGAADVSAARGAGGGSEGATRELNASDGASAAGSDTAANDEGGSGALVALIAALVAAVGVLAGGLWLHGHPRVRRGRHADDADELRAALARLGRPLSPRTTLAELERRLRLSAGEEAARYARLVRERRFGPPGGRGPTRHDRRALRRALAAGAGPLGRLKALIALPPRRAV